MKVLLRLRHGIGDAVQFTIILRHLKYYHPDWEIDVEAAYGKHSCFFGLANEVYIFDIKPTKEYYHQTYDISWPEANYSFEHVPSSKPAKCLKEIFDLEPLEELFKYKIEIQATSVSKANNYIKTLPKNKGFVLIHYEGNSSPWRKNISEEYVRLWCDYLLENEYTPVILDWDYRSIIPNQITVFCPDKNNPMWGGQSTGDANILAALCDKAALFIGIDSGPAHVAAATKTKGIVIWTQHHPVNFFDLNSSFTHLIPTDVRNYVKVGSIRRNQRPEIDKAIRYFESKYDFKYYRDLNVVSELICQKLGISSDKNPMLSAKVLKSVNYGESYYNEHLAAGLDYLSYGSWQKDYTRWLTSSLNLHGKSVLDVGCACGAICNGFHEMGTAIRGCDVNEHCVRLGRDKWHHLKLYVCDAVNLHHFSDNSFDFIHMMQTAEHFKPELVPFILKELNRIAKPTALIFSVHDTAELFEKQKRGDGDPTHTCIKSRDWWDIRFESTGWMNCRDEYLPRLQGEDSFLKLYDWDWCLYRKQVYNTAESGIIS